MTRESAKTTLVTQGRTIRAKLVFAFGTLLFLGALNTGVYYWGAFRRARVFEHLHRSEQRLITIMEAQSELGDINKQMTLLVGPLGTEKPGPFSREEQQQFRGRIERITVRLGGMPKPRDPRHQSRRAELVDSVKQLGESWKKVYVSVSSNPIAAISEQVSHSDPLAMLLLGTELPQAVSAEKEQLQLAQAEFEQTDRTTSIVALILFVISAGVGALLAVLFSRHLLRSIRSLNRGAEKLGAGDLEHRVSVVSRDELGTVARSFNEMADRLKQRTEENEEQRKLSESLLLNILPRAIAEELREKGRVEAKYYPDTTILFTDIVKFTRLFESMSVDRMVRLLDDTFTVFDRVVREYRLEKLKTIGDAYMCAGGLSREGASHPIDAVMAAFAMIDSVQERAREEGIPLAIRVGIHTGPVAAGVVGIDKFAFDVWGDTVNFAARLQATSEPNCINVSSSTHLRVKDFFECEYRGQIETKEARSFDMFFVRGVHRELRGAGSPPPPFQNRYRIYFEKPPSGFPRILATA